MHPVEEYQDIILTVDRLNWVRFVTPTRRRWATNNYITQVKTGSQAVRDQTSWRKDAGMRNMSQRGWAHRPSVKQPRRTGKKHCYGHKSGSQYVAVLFGLQLPLTVKLLVTLSNPFKLNERCIFLMNCVARLYCVVVMIMHASAYVYVYSFMAIQQRIDRPKTWTLKTYSKT